MRKVLAALVCVLVLAPASARAFVSPGVVPEQSCALLRTIAGRWRVLVRERNGSETPGVGELVVDARTPFVWVHASGGGSSLSRETTRPPDYCESPHLSWTFATGRLDIRVFAAALLVASTSGGTSEVLWVER